VTDLVRVWIVPVDVPPDTAARCRDVLDDSELKARPPALTWTPGRYGKPELVPPWTGLHTSLSQPLPAGGLFGLTIL